MRRQAVAAPVGDRHELVRRARPDGGERHVSTTIKTINTGVLSIAYLEYGAASGWPCILGHGFPYDVACL